MEYTQVFIQHTPDKYGFRDRLPDSNKGLLCCFFVHPIEKVAYLSLRLPDLPVERIIQNMLNALPHNNQHKDENVIDTISKVIKSMDTEYDRQCAKVLLCSSNCNNSDLYSFGINPQTAKKHIERVQNIVTECENAEVAAQDIVNLRIDSKIEELKSRKIALESGIRKMAYRTTHSQLDELIQEKEDIDDAIKEQQDMKDGKTQYHSQKLHQAIKRTAENLGRRHDMVQRSVF